MLARECDPKDVGVCFLLDEILKVPEDPRQALLDELTSAMQSDLATDLPTFMLATSLEVAPVHKVVQKLGRRPWSPVLLHVLSNDDKRAIVESAFDILITCLGVACGWIDTLDRKNLNARQKKYLEAEGKGFVYRFLEYNVFHTTHHYRSVEEVVLNIFQHFIPARDEHTLTRKRKNGEDDYSTMPSFQREVFATWMWYCKRGAPKLIPP